MAERYPSSQDIRDLTADPQPNKAPIAILPIGCTEQHGPFLPLETDTLIASGMSRSIALLFKEAGFPAHVLPDVAYSPTRSNASFPGTVSVGERAFRDYLSSVLHSLITSEFGTIILLSAHGPADPFLREIAFVAVDEQFRRAAALPKPVIPASVADASSELRTHFTDPPGRHADWREFLLVYHILGREYFTEDRIQSLQDFHRENDFTFSTGHVPGVPLEYRSVHGVIGQPLPEGREAYAKMADKAWMVIRDRLFADLTSALEAFQKTTGRG